nr:hypothetical protein [Kibdelosporangium sp. MJ126-NF4]
MGNRPDTDGAIQPESAAPFGVAINAVDRCATSEWAAANPAGPGRAAGAWPVDVRLGDGRAARDKGIEDTSGNARDAGGRVIGHPVCSDWVNSWDVCGCPIASGDTADGCGPALDCPADRAPAAAATDIAIEVGADGPGACPNAAARWMAVTPPVVSARRAGCSSERAGETTMDAAARRTAAAGLDTAWSVMCCAWAVCWSARTAAPGGGAIARCAVDPPTVTPFAVDTKPGCAWPRRGSTDSLLVNGLRRASSGRSTGWLGV